MKKITNRKIFITIYITYFLVICVSSVIFEIPQNLHIINLCILFISSLILFYWK